MSVTVDVISIGCLSRNRFWNEDQSVRPAHATTTCIRTPTATILVDPALPASILAQRLDERAGLKPDQIDVVFLTNFRPAHRRGLPLFEQARWYMFESEIQAVSRHLNALLQQEKDANVSPDPLIREELAVLARIAAAPDKLSSAVDLFPTPGVTPGACGLLVLFPNMTLAVAGDAVISKDYFQDARIYEHCADTEAAKQSFAEVIEIADAFIPGHDNTIYR